MKKTIIVVPKYTERNAEFIKTLMADAEFSSSRFCALLSDLDPDVYAGGNPVGGQGMEGSGLPLELKKILWNTVSAFAGASAMLQINNHFSGYPDEVLVLEDDEPFCGAGGTGSGFGMAMKTFALALPEFILRLAEEDPELNSIVHVRLACGEQGVVPETLSGALKGFYGALRSASATNPYCSTITDETGSVLQLVPYCVKVMNVSRKENRDYVFSGKSGFFGKM